MKKPLEYPEEQLLALRDGQPRDPEYICYGQLKVPKSHHYDICAICGEHKGYCFPNSFKLET